MVLRSEGDGFWGGGGGGAVMTMKLWCDHDGDFGKRKDGSPTPDSDQIGTSALPR